MNKFKKIIAFVFIGLAVLTVTACKRSGNEDISPKKPVTIHFFNAIIENVDWYQEKIDVFQKDNPGIKVEIEFQKDFDNALKVKFQTNDIPEIVNGGYAQVYADQGRYLDLSDQSEWWNRLLPGVQGICTDYKTGKNFYFTTNTSSFGLLYNKAIYAELGLSPAKTTAEFISNLQAIHEKKPDIAPLHVGSKDAWMLGQMMDVWGYSPIREINGNLETKKALIENKQELLKFEDSKGAISLFGDVILALRDNKLLNSDFLTATYDNSLDAFANGKAATLMQGLWTLPQIQEKNPSFIDNVGFSVIPALQEGGSPCVLNAPDIKYSICAESAHPEEAKIFLEYLFSPEIQKDYTEFRQSPTAFTDVNADWGPLKKDVEAALSEGFAVDWSDAPIGFAPDDVGRMIQDLYVGKYASGQDFAVAYANTWIKAWAATYQ